MMHIFPLKSESVTIFSSSYNELHFFFYKQLVYKQLAFSLKIAKQL